ncbi:MAG: hypothetical protein R3B57_09880 [Phycisphaerales bacterium]
MSGRVVMAWVCVAGVLAAVYLLVSGGSGGGAGHRAPGQVITTRLAIDPGTVVALRVETGGARVAVERDPASATGWVVRWHEGDRDVAWAAREQAVRAGVRTFAAAALDPREGGSKDETLDGATIEVEMSDGVVSRMRLGGEAVGGRVAARVGVGAGEETVWAPREIAAAIDPVALLAWREMRLMPPIGGSEASGLTIEGGESGVTLRRVRGKWSLERPIEARADEARVQDVLGRLGSIEAEELDAGGAADGVMRLDHPAATIMVETERREARGDGFDRVVTRQTLEVGGEADASGKTRFVRAGEVVEREGKVEAELGPVVGIMEVAVLGRVTARAEAYVAKAPVGVSPGDVGVVSLARVGGGEVARFERDRRGWRRVDGGRAEAVGEGEAAGLGALLELCCGSGFERVEVLGRESGVTEPIGVVSLETLGGGKLASFEVAGADGDTGGIVARDGGVFWIATGEGNASIARWLASLVEKAGN